MKAILGALLGQRSFHEQAQSYLPQSCREHGCQVALRDPSVMGRRVATEETLVASYFQHQDTVTGIVTLYPILRADVDDESVDIWSPIRAGLETMHRTEDDGATR